MFKKILSILVIFFAFLLTFAGIVNAAEKIDSPHWQKSPIKVYIPKDPMQTSMRHAFERWQNKSFGKLKFEFVNKGPADIDVVFTEKTDGTDGPIASYSVTIKGKAITKSEIKIAAKSKNISKYSKNYVFTTMLHEVGHSLGLDDNSRKTSSIMHMPINEKQEIMKVDMMKLYHLYGWNWAKKNISQ